MAQARYQISEAARLLHVESHVLRYWEEELGIEIPRNEMGHREYTKRHIQMFRKILDMKEEGFQLRAIRAALKKDLEEIKKMEEEHSLVVKEEEKMKMTECESPKEERFEQFHTIMNQIMVQALEANNEKLGRQFGRVLNQLMVLQEEKEEERFRHLDELLRAYQATNKMRSEVAATKSPVIPLRKKKKLFPKRSV
jgi:DNA-binding transcriptional MerR regulator